MHIQYPNGTQEFFKYDVEGSLHRYCGQDGTVQVFEYDGMGRNLTLSTMARQYHAGNWMSSVYFNHDSFDLMFSKDEQGNKTRHT